MVAAPPGRVQVVAHRGASADEAEHTLAAYRRAIADGADGLECDVRLTRDGVLVCVHDRRINRTSTGHGAVSKLELADMAELDFGSWRGTGARPGTDPGHEPHGVLTLEKLIETAVDCGRPLDLAIETKHPTRAAGLVELTLVETLARFGLDCPDPRRHVNVRVMSFASSSLRRVRALAAQMPTVLLMQRIPPSRRDGSLPHVAEAAGPSIRAVRAFPSYVERVHAHGHEVHVWTVDDPADVDLVSGLGVDVVITNRPAAVRQQLAGAASSH